LLQQAKLLRQKPSIAPAHEKNMGD